MLTRYTHLYYESKILIKGIDNMAYWTGFIMSNMHPVSSNRLFNPRDWSYYVGEIACCGQKGARYSQQSLLPMSMFDLELSENKVLSRMFKFYIF